MMQQIKPYILPSIVLLLFTAGYYPAFDSLITKWSASDDYTHAFFTVPVVAYMIWLQRDLLAESKGRPVIGLVLIILSIFLYLVSLQLQIPTITFIATVLTVISILIYFAGFRVLKEMAIPILLLFMVIPIPNQLLSMITASLQLKVSQASETIIQLFSVPLFREGNVLQIPGKTFQVVQACSGIRSLISMTTLSLIIGYFTLTRGRSILFLFLFSIPVAVVINIVRVISLVLIYYYFKIDITSGTWHTISGLLLFVLGLVLLFSFQRILEYWEGKKQYS
ncbi:MAG: exosortase/archaeosortase family protein [Deltaproteobacteria bacterium]|nr:exosortase/archaeosortase family protein [Deltaproteobacteria bacterium]